MRGQKKPTVLKKLDGTYRADRALPNEFTPEVLDLIPECPPDKEPGFAGIWEDVCGNLKEVGMLNKIDLYAIESYCQALMMFRKACKALKDKGYTVNLTTNRGSAEVISPWVRVQSEANKVMLNFQKEFGFSPASRTKIPQPGKKKADNPFQKLQGGVG